MYKNLISLTTTITFISHVIGTSIATATTADSAFLLKKELASHDNNFSYLWFTLRDSVSPESRSFLDTWYLQNQSTKVSNFDIIKIKCAEQDCLRIIAQIGKKNINIEISSNEEVFGILNGQKITKAESLNVIEKLTINSASKKIDESESLKISKTPISFSDAELKKMNSEQKILYITNLRLLLDDAANIKLKKSQKKSAYLGSWWMNYAQAEIIEEFSCITKSGYINLVKDSQCHEPQQALNSCSVGQVACNPMLYGINEKNQNYCRTQQESCDDIVPLRKDNFNTDYKRLAAGLDRYLKKNQNSQINFDVTRRYEKYLNEIASVCENEKPLSNECKTLLQRRAIFNSYLVDEKSNSQQAQIKKSNPKKQSNTIEQTTDTCGWWCRNESWALPASIIGGSLVGFFAICKYTSFSLGGLCGNKKASSSATSDALAIPTAPTSADYTSGIR